VAKKSKTKAEALHLERVASLGCIVCRSPAEVHHLTGAGMGLKAPHYKTIPLCHIHHRTGGLGIAIHAGTKTWEKEFGEQEMLLGRTLEMLEKLYPEHYPLDNIKK
jgi:hypothetical protein